MPRAVAKPQDENAPDLARLRRMFEEARDMTQAARLESTTDQDYYDTKQWTAAEKTALADRGQPDTIFNRIKPAINGIIGVTEQGRSEPRAFPRTPKDEDSADVATDVLRFIADQNRFNRTKQDCFLDLLVPGTMAALITADRDGQIQVNQIRWEEFFADPRSRRKDHKDARYLGIAKWMYADDVQAMYPDKKADIGNVVDAGGMDVSESFQDRPEAGWGGWVDRGKRRMMVVELYHREAGQWMRCVYHGGGLLDYGPSSYLDQKGRPDCPIEAQSAYVDRENNRYGVVRDMRGPQDEINKRRSKLLHLLSVSQIQAVDPSAIEVDSNVARKEAARPDGVIPFGWQKVATSDMAAGNAQLLIEAKSEIERMGPNPAVVGRDNADASGRALQARTQAGLIELGLIYGGLEDWELRVYRQMWARAKQFWNAPMYIRVTDDEDAPKFVGINQPKGQPQLDPTGQPVMDQQGQPVESEPQFHPESGEPVFGYKNPIAEMDVDIVLETTPDTANLQQEQFNELVRLAGSNPALAQSIPFDIWLDMSNIPHKRQIKDRIKQAQEQAAKVQAEAAEIAKAQAMAKIEETQASAALKGAQAGNEHADAFLKGANSLPIGGDAGAFGPTDSYAPQQ